jgi:hypothetical protein
MAPNKVTGIGSPKRPHPATLSLLADTRHLPWAAGADAGEIRHDWRRKHLSSRLRQKQVGRECREEEDLLRAEGVLGYPASWPAGPWFVPLFWLTVVVLALLLRSLG